jgi:hypothetical protein
VREDMYERVDERCAVCGRGRLNSQLLASPNRDAKPTDSRTTALRRTSFAKQGVLIVVEKLSQGAGPVFNVLR